MNKSEKENKCLNCNQQDMQCGARIITQIILDEIQVHKNGVTSALGIENNHVVMLGVAPLNPMYEKLV